MKTINIFMIMLSINFTHKIVVNKSSIFATWPQQYYYTLDINLDTKKVDSKWENLR